MLRGKKFAVKALVYISLSSVFAFALAGAALLDAQQNHNINLLDILTKLLIITGIFAYSSLCGMPMNAPGSRVFTFWLLAALIPAFANTVNTLCIPNYYPGTTETINLAATMFTTAVWEEMYFRYVGKTLFEQEGKYSIGAVVLLSVAFGVTHMINIFFYDPVSVLIQLLSASISGVFWLALYRHTGSLTLTIIAHFLQNFMGTFFQTFTTAESFYVQTASRPGISVMILCSIMELTVGVYILKKYNYISK